MCAAGHFRTASPDLKIQLPEAFDQENEPAGRPLARFAGLGFLLGAAGISVSLHPDAETIIRPSRKRG